MTKDVQTITRASLGRTEAAFVTGIGKKRFFTIDDARKALGHGKNDPTGQFLERLTEKGWILRIKRGLYVTVPLSAGKEANPQIHEFLIAMQLISPAAIAYWTALN
jgi:predicted transcriptional regulator of viral defense system